MPNVRPSNVAPTVAIPPGLVDLATRLAADLPARIGAEVNPSRRIIRSFLHHVNAAAKAEKRRLVNKARGWEPAAMKAAAAKAGHDKAASDLLPLVREILDGHAKSEDSTPAGLTSEAATIGEMLATAPAGSYRVALENRATMIRDELAAMASESAVAAVTHDRRDSEGGEVG